MIRRPARAFTLVELLVVIGIVALLIAILLPSLASARRSANGLRCRANLRTLGQALLLHANDHKGCLPLAGNIVPGTTLLGRDDPASLGDPSAQRYTYYHNDPTTVCVTALPAALAPYLGARRIRDDTWQHVDADIQAPGPVQDAFVCPCDQCTIDRTYGSQRWINNYGSATFLEGWSSYGVNAEIFAWTDNGLGGTTGHSRLRGRLAAVPHPADTMLMCDTYQAIEIWVLGPNLSLGDVYLGTGGTVGHGVFDLQRHRGGINLLYADGHVDSASILSTGGTRVSGDVGSPGNAPSGALMDVSVDKDFR